VVRRARAVDEDKWSEPIEKAAASGQVAEAVARQLERNHGEQPPRRSIFLMNTLLFLFIFDKYYLIIN